MNFKYYLVVFIFLVGCGVKGDPVAPRSAPTPSLLQENYPDIETRQPLDELRKM